jgi:hypothetical protein
MKKRIKSILTTVIFVTKFVILLLKHFLSQSHSFLVTLQPSYFGKIYPFGSYCTIGEYGERCYL